MTLFSTLDRTDEHSVSQKCPRFRRFAAAIIGEEAVAFDRFVAASMVLAVAPLWALGCSNGGEEPAGPPTRAAAGSITVRPDSATIEQGSTVQLTATVRDRLGNVLFDRKVTWSSSDSAVAAVEPDGLVGGAGAGTATVTASVGSVSDSAVITVIGPVTQVTINPDSASILVSQKFSFTVTARDDAGRDRFEKMLQLTSSDPEVVVVDSIIGRVGLITAVGEGMAVVTATVDRAADSALVVVQTPLAFESLSAGGMHTCAVTTDTASYCWGSNANGRLGRTGPGFFVPASVFTNAVFVEVVAGGMHTCALSRFSALFCWGRGDQGQLGQGARLDESTPSQVTVDHEFAGVTVGDRHTCGWTGDGGAFCWGANEAGQVGDGTSVDRDSPVAVSGNLSWQALTAGKRHTCGITLAGRAYCWGANDLGQLGDGTTDDHIAPVPVAGDLKFAMLSSGGTHTCGVTDVEEVHCWGGNTRGQLGNGTTDGSAVPVKVVREDTWTGVSAGAEHTCAIGTGPLFDTNTYCWGANDTGQLGDASLIDRLAPARIATGLKLRLLTAGRAHTCGLGGTIALCWGRGDSGQLGIKEVQLPPAPGPRPVTIPTKVDRQL